MKFNPFNPQSPARPEYFTGREFEMSEYEKYLTQTIFGSPMNMSVTGNRGIGKTSILIKMEAFAKEKNCLVIRMSNYEENIHDTNELTNFLIVTIRQALYENTLLEGKIAEFGEWVKSLKPVIGYKDLSLTFTQDDRKLLAESALRKQLIKIWEKIKDEYSAIVILIDEAESLDRIAGGMSFLREVFQRISHDTKYMVVLCGKLNFPEKMSESFSPLCRFFPSFTLSPFDKKETFNYIDKMLYFVNCYATNEVKEEIFKQSDGHPYVVVKMCEITFNQLNNGENEMSINHFRVAYPKIILDLERDFFFPMYYPLTPKAKEIINKLSSMDKIDFTFKETMDFTGMGSSKVSPYISELVRKGCLDRPERANYHFFHKLFLKFIQKRALET
jgi:hypothetical protein